MKAILPGVGRIFFVVISVAICHGIHGQDPGVEDLRIRLPDTVRDSTHIKLYYEYGDAIRLLNPDSASWYFNRAREYSGKLNYKRGEAAYASHAIPLLNNQGKFREALQLTEEALALYEAIGNRRDRAVANLNVGSEWQYLSDFQLASEYYLKAKKLADEIADQRLQRITNNNLASIFINLEDYEKGKAYAENSLAIARAMEDDYAISSSTYNIATAELYLEEYDAALSRYSEIRAIGEKTDDFIVILDGLLGMGDVYSAKGNPSMALLNYEKVIKLAKEQDAPEYEMYALMGVSDVHIFNRQFGAAEESIQDGMGIAAQLGSKFELKELYLKASELYEQTLDFEQALDFRKKFEVLNDSIVGEKSRFNISMLEARFESEKKESRIENLEADKQMQLASIEQKNSLNYLLIGSALTLLLISMLTYRNYRIKQKLQAQRINELEQEKQITAMEAVLKGEDQERTRLAKDLHDGLGGMLSGIKYSFQNIKGNLVMTPDNQHAFERSMDMLDTSIREMRRVSHNMMPESLVKFGLDTALRDFCNEINTSGALVVNYQSLGLDEAAELDQTTAVTLYRIIQELTNNILKHASAKMAIVQVSKIGDLVTLTVEDDGRGFNTAVLQQTKGMGWSNIQNRVGFLKGNINVVSEPKKGSSVHMEFMV